MFRKAKFPGLGDEMKSLPVAKSAVVPKLAEPKIEAKTIENRSLPQTQSLSRLSEQSFGAGLRREILNQKLDRVGEGGAQAAAAVKPAVDYFEIDRRADELIKKHTDDGIIWDSLNTDNLGRELADTAKTDPDTAAALTDNILDKIDGGDKDEIAQSFVESLNPEELREFAATDRGRELLGTLRHHLDEGATWDDEEATMRRIDNSIKAADFEKSPEFKALSPEVQQEVMSRLDSNQGDNTATDNLLRLARSPEFAGLDAASARSILGAFDTHKGDNDVASGLIRLSGNADFRGLNQTQQSAVIADIDRYVTTDTYQDDTDVADRNYLFDLIAGTSVYSQQHPELTSVRNSLDRVLSNDLTIEAYTAASDPQYAGANGYVADSSTFRMNRDLNSVRPISGQLDTLVHEVNHIVNGETDAGTPERFLDEYGARVVGREAGGQPFSEAIQRASLDQLTSGGGSYQHLNDLYNSNADFKAVIDAVYADLNKTPPVLTTPEQLRERLLAAGFDSDYMQAPRNLDNN